MGKGESGVRVRRRENELGGREHGLIVIACREGVVVLGEGRGIHRVLRGRSITWELERLG